MCNCWLWFVISSGVMSVLAIFLVVIGYVTGEAKGRGVKEEDEQK